MLTHAISRSDTPTNGDDAEDLADDLVTHRGHDPHFLSRLARVSLPHVELAMSIYRDPGLLRFILDSARVAQGAARVAIALTDGGDGPYLLVARDGHFVTCLGEGMSPGELPIISRGQLDVLSEKINTLRERLATARSVSEGGAARLMARLFSAGPTLTREEFVALSVCAPLMVREIFRWSAEASSQVAYLTHRLRRVDKLGPRDEPLLRRYWNLVWSQGHLTLLGGLTLRDVTLPDPSPLHDVKAMVSWPAVRSGVMGVALRGAWAAGHLGKQSLPGYKAAWIAADSLFKCLDKSIGLVAIASRSSALRAEVAKTLRRPHAPILADVEGNYPTVLGALMASIAESANDLADPESESQVAYKFGALFYQRLSANTAAPQFASDAEVPPDHALPALMSLGSPFIREVKLLQQTLLSVPWVARAEPQDLYFPAAIAEALAPRWCWQSSVDILGDHLAVYGKSRPARAAKVPGRNEPCHCGSGSKYKKCCATTGTKVSLPT